jgi:hypothetical protein
LIVYASISIGGPIFFVLGSVCFVVWRRLARAFIFRGIRFECGGVLVFIFGRRRTTDCRTWRISHCGPQARVLQALIS